MTRPLVLAVAAAITLGAAGPAPAERVFVNADRLRHWCLAKGAPLAACRGYLMGVVDLLRDRPRHGRAQGPCIPDGLQAEQARLVFLAHLHASPELGQRAAAEQVRVALATAFGCADPEPPADTRRDRERLS